ncbi:hypothetical protein G6F56_012746 [Rhizopus delemar]|nr:hypothetical protein G6F56_012746 [Rhizopus delemar]
MSTELPQTAIQLLEQSIQLIDGTLTDQSFTFESKVMPGSTIGKHLRHLCDHFHLLYKQVSVWNLDYDKRNRDTPAENDLLVAKSRLIELQKTVQENNKVPLDTPITLIATIDSKDSQKHQFQSSFGRELFYCCIHAIHHYASIKAICIEFGLSVPYEFGVAPSTLQHLQNK